MTSHDEYFSYLMKRSFLGGVYRRNWLYPKISSYLDGLTLDVGCGIGDMLSYRANTMGVDVNSRNVDYCQSKGLDAYVMEPDILPFDSSVFDSALLDNVLEHIANPEPLLREIKRVLRPKGSLVVGVPGAQGFASDADHKVFYDEGSLVSALRDAQFSLRKIFHMPFRSKFLNEGMRQYCVYGVFQRD
ncbi:MAG: methyltransferase domain-containing protein [Azonexaceae bacterium]|nr:methyltransferase domain-containing protein [Azonexaceae bacterium]